VLDAQSSRRAHVEVGPASLDALGRHIQRSGELRPRQATLGRGVQHRQHMRGHRGVIRQQVGDRGARRQQRFDVSRGRWSGLVRWPPMRLWGSNINASLDRVGSGSA